MNLRRRSKDLPDTVHNVAGQSSSPSKRDRFQLWHIIVFLFWSVFIYKLPHLRGEKSLSGPTSQMMKYVHDNPLHPWHWTRELPPDPVISKLKDCDGVLYEDLYDQFHREGWVVFRSCSLQRDAEVLNKVANFTATIKTDRVVDAKVKQVKMLGSDQDTMRLINYLHGGRYAHPYQTLNFPVGTQQGLHSDLVHFDSQPRTLMTAAWVALEDMNENNGPLRFYPRSHRFGTWDFEETGLHYKYKTGEDPADDQSNYSKELERAMAAAGLKEVQASTLKKGQTFLWAAALVHGGSKQKDLSLSRLSQVTHYFFDGYEYLWQPRSSDRGKGKIQYIRMDEPSCGRQFMKLPHGSTYFSCGSDQEIGKWASKYSQEL